MPGLRRRSPRAWTVQRALDLPEDASCAVIGLGGYTSIVTRNGKALATRRAVLATGNSLTAAMTLGASRAWCTARRSSA